jgi:hypothetical protein
LDYLRREHNFQVTTIEQVLFYKNCTVLPEIYRELVIERAAPTTSASRKDLLKKVVNFSCGFFGFNPENAGKSSYRLVADTSKTPNPAKCEITSAGFVGNEEFYLLKVLKNPPKDKENQQKKSPGPLPLFFSIVEFGKMRIAQILHFFETFTLPNAYRHLYSNVDNVVIALSTPGLVHAIPPHLFERFMAEVNNYFQPGQPGHLKKEWINKLEDEWKFVSHMVQNWAVITNREDKNRNKNSALSKVTSSQSYQISCDVLDKKITKIQQNRRSNKMLNTETIQQTFTF